MKYKIIRVIIKFSFSYQKDRNISRGNINYWPNGCEWWISY